MRAESVLGILARVVSRGRSTSLRGGVTSSLKMVSKSVELRPSDFFLETQFSANAM